MDRTRDFMRMTSEAVVVPQTPSPAPTKPIAAPLDRKERSKQVLFFNERAGEVSKGIHACSILLSRLTTLARAQTLFNDPKDEMSTLSVTVKNEISTLKTRLGELETWLKRNDLGTGQDSKKHSEQVVKTMEYKLQDTGKQFAKVLETQKNALRAQSERKKMFGDEEDFEDIGKPLPQSTFDIALQQDEEAGLVGTNSEAIMTSASLPLAQMAHSQLIPDTQYLHSRVEAISSVETHIRELGTVMTKLAEMVHSQDHLVNDMLVNVETSEASTNAGIAQLEKYYRSLIGNKKLLSRLFGVLVSFLLFFLIFLA